MNQLRRVLIIAVAASLLVSACGTGREPASPPESLEPVLSTSPSVVAARPTMEPVVVAGCPVIGADQIASLVALAIDGLADTTSDDGWSRASALVRASDELEAPHVVTIEIGWEGTLIGFAAIPGTEPIVGLADEAYALDGGRRIALRAGELVALVSSTGETPGTETLARLVAAQVAD